jgi:predicted O-linked N-acetylglucosamine transferase (SPINDLY family)
MNAVPPRAAPQEVERLLDAAIRAQSEGRLPDAAAAFERVLALSPDHHDALVRYAMLVLAAGRPDVALGAAKRASVAHPRSAVARNVLGVALRRGGRLADAIAALRDAVALDATLVDAQVNLGNALLDAGDPKAALPCYERALALDPASASVHNNLGNLYRELRRPVEALDAYTRALALDPRHARAQANAGNILKDLGDADAAIAAFRRSLALAPDAADVWSNLLFTLNCRDGITPEEVAAEHRAFGAHFARRLQPLAPVQAPRRPGRLRVGYVSADFRKHAVATLFEPLLEHHDRAKVEVFCYYNQPRGDEVTARIQARAEHFVPIAGVPDRVLAERIRQDGIDILFDLTGHSADNRLPLFFLRPAPVQVTWLGYLGGTGVPTIDWRLTDPHVDPPAAPAPPGVEKPWRLPHTMWCYRPYADAPPIGPLPAAQAGHATFACLNNPGKVSPGALDAWAAILRALPGARLILLTPASPERVAALRRRFERAGVAPSRIDCVERAPLAQYLALHARVDIALDPFPYTGGVTTCDAAWMGVPVVTLAGNRPFARSGATILANLNLDELVANDVESYVAAAIGLARDRARLAEIRATLRARMQASKLTDAAAFARDFEEALAAMWEHHAGERIG